MYYTVREEGHSEYTEKKSVFRGYLRRCTSEEEAKEYIAYVRTLDRDIRHAVYAYSIGENSEIKRYSDDGEPQGTGGMPVLSVLEKNDIKDAVIVVTRYFGGILLGASGLARAYGRAASDAVASVDRVRIESGFGLSVRMPYDIYSRAERYLEEENIRVIGKEFSSEVEVTVDLLKDDVPGFRERIKDLSLDRAVFREPVKKRFFVSDKGIIDEVTD